MRVFIGDPCYVLSDDNYMKMLEVSYWCDDLDDGTLVHPDIILNRPEGLSDEDIEESCEEFYGWGNNWRNGNGNCFPVDKNGNPLDSVKVMSTWMGDGCYGDEDEKGYSVDSGQLGMVPEHLWDLSNRTEEQLNWLGKIVEIDGHDDWFCYDLQGNGTLRLGEVTIPTGPGDFDGNLLPDEEED